MYTASSLHWVVKSC